MRHFSGIGSGSGIAVGTAYLLKPRIQIAERSIPAELIPAELGRLTDALARTDAALVRIGLESSAPSELGADLVSTHREMLKSEAIAEEALRLVREHGIAAESAVRRVLEQLRALFMALEDETFRARLGDVEAVAEHLLRSLAGVPEPQYDETLRGAVVVGIELSPLDALQLHALGIAGFATERGGLTAHEAIIARTLGIPYVFGLRGLVERVRAGDLLCIDAARGEVVLRPDAEALGAFTERRAHEAERWRLAQAQQRAPAVTLDGTPISLGANVSSTAEIRQALEAGADHIGLVRTELLYLDRLRVPGEEEQLQDALAMVRAAAGCPVTFRTLDLGGDKLPRAVQIAVGPNPALGLRGIRFSLRRPDLFRTQLRALYRAAAVGPLRILFPLVSSVSEMREARSLCAQVCAELAASATPHEPRTPLGAMIETPSAVLTVDHIAAESDFMSVGTNDLIQYTFAADRQNEDMTYLYQPLHPSILRALQQVLVTGQRLRCPVSVCGDMAGDPANAWALLGLGLRCFSMAARELVFVKSLLRKTTLAEAEQLAKASLLLTCTEDVAALAREHPCARPRAQPRAQPRSHPHSNQR